jgi:N-formylglutamate amidohydrolase
MVEVNRRLYMDEQTGAKLAGFEDVRRRVGEAVRTIAAAGERSPNGG